MMAIAMSPIDAAKKLAAKQLRMDHSSLVIHSYKDATGKIIYWRIRIDHYDGKWIRPMYQDENGQYHLCEPPDFKNKLKPLYGLDLLSTYLNAIVLVVEGEKCADNLNKFFSEQKVMSEYLAITSGCATSDSSVDWKPLKGRDVLIWPDNDESGLKYAGRVIKKLRTKGCEALLLDISQFGLPSGGDCVDFLHANSSIKIDEMIRLFAYKELNDDSDATSPSSLKPIPLPTLPSVMPFNAEKMLPNAIRDYIIDVADRQQSPIDFAAVSSIVGLSSVLGGKVQVRPKQNDDWTVTPNQWGAIVGRPSAMKSPSMKEVLKPLREIEQEALKLYEEEVKEYKINTHLADVEMNNAKEKAKRFIKNGDKESAKSMIVGARYDEPVPIRNRLIVNDATVEKLGELLNENPNGLALVRDELSGWLARLMKEEFQGERAFILECFDGNGHFVYDRILRGTIEIKNCILSVIGGIQPSKIAPLVRSALKGTSDDGLVQRLQLAVWPEDQGSWVWKDRAPNKQAYARYQAVFKQLHELDLKGEADESCYLRFSSHAQELFIDWMNKLQMLARSDEIHPVLESHLLKMPKTIAGLALLFELIDGGRECIGITALNRALAWAEYLQSHAERLYSIINNSEVENARLILSRRNKLSDCFTIREIQRKRWSGLDCIPVISEALDCLIDHRYLHSVVIPSDSHGGRPTVKYCWS